MTFSNYHRVYINMLLASNIIITLDNNYQHYLSVVLRLKKNSCFRIFNEREGEFLAKIITANKNSLTAEVGQFLRNSIKEPSLELGLCMIKNDKMLIAINMAVQLGVTAITPLLASRSQIRSINQQRLGKYIIEATEQSERLSPPIFNNPTTLSDYCNQSDRVIIYANEKEEITNSIQKIYKEYQAKLSRVSDSTGKLTLIIGPEGGFIEQERYMLASLPNCFSVSLGQNILRTETAVTAGLAQLQMLRLAYNMTAKIEA